MGKNKNRNKRRKRRKRNRQNASQNPESIRDTRMQEGSVHPLLAGRKPPPQFQELLTENFQRELRNSPLWDEMVREFGEDEAEKLLKQCQAKLIPSG